MVSFPIRKGNIAWLTAASFAISCLSLATIFVWSDFRFTIGYIGMKAIGLLGLIFFGYGTFIGLKKLTDTKPGLLIDESGIVENSHGSSPGFVPWADIAGIRMDGTPFIFIDLKDAQTVLEKMGKINQGLGKENLALFGTPIVIDVHLLNAPRELVEGALMEAWKKHGGNEAPQTDL